jgi:hypothetical protein
MKTKILQLPYNHRKWFKILTSSSFNYLKLLILKRKYKASSLILCFLRIKTSSFIPRYICRKTIVLNTYRNENFQMLQITLSFCRKCFKVAKAEIFILYAKTIFMLSHSHFFKASDMAPCASGEEESAEKRRLEIKLWRDIDIEAIIKYEVLFVHIHRTSSYI